MNGICVVTALRQTGRVAMVEPETTVRLETGHSRTSRGTIGGTFTAEDIVETTVGPYRAVPALHGGAGTGLGLGNAAHLGR